MPARVESVYSSLVLLHKVYQGMVPGIKKRHRENVSVPLP
jgi:hypothetical protein